MRALLVATTNHVKIRLTSYIYIPFPHSKPTTITITTTTTNNNNCGDTYFTLYFTKTQPEEVHEAETEFLQLYHQGHSTQTGTTIDFIEEFVTPTEAKKSGWKDPKASEQSQSAATKQKAKETKAKPSKPAPKKKPQPTKEVTKTDFESDAFGGGMNILFE